MRVFYNLAIFGEEEKKEVNEVLDGFMIVGGKKTREFEEKASALLGKKHGVLTNSGSSANLLSLELLNMPVGSEVITPAVTFGTTLSPIYHKRLIPSYVDVGEGDYQIDVNKVEASITNKTRALFIPSLMGNIPDYRALREIADKYKLWFIEDSCDTLGAKIGGKPAGRYSDITTCSFYASHIITTGGHGGIISFNNKDWIDRVRTLVSWGRSSARNETEDISVRFDISVDGIPYDAKFVFEELGYNFQSTDIDAAFGLGQLKSFSERFETRRRNFSGLYNYFKSYEKYFILPVERANVETAWLAFPLTIRDNAPFRRKELATFFEQKGIQTRPFFTGNVLRQPAFKNLPSRKAHGGYPIADMVMRGSFVIGCHHGMDQSQIDYIKNTFEDFIAMY